MFEIHYKIVSVRENGDRMSFNYSDSNAVLNNPRDLLYKIGEWTHPFVVYGPLFVFDTLEHAVSYLTSFVEYPQKCEIYECEVNSPCNIGVSHLLDQIFSEEHKKNTRFFYDVKITNMVYKQEIES